MKELLDAVPIDKVNKEELLSTNTVTNKGDGFEFGKEIFKNIKNNNLYVLDDTGPNDEWVIFTKNVKN